MQQQLLSGASGQLQAAAALLVELARAASAANLAAQGNPAALTANTAAVLRGSGAGECFGLLRVFQYMLSSVISCRWMLWRCAHQDMTWALMRCTHSGCMLQLSAAK